MLVVNRRSLVELKVGTEANCNSALAIPGVEREGPLEFRRNAFGARAPFAQPDRGARSRTRDDHGAWQIEVHDQTVTHGKVVGTRLQFADYAAMARSFGMHAERVETEEQLKPAIERALANRPALLDMVVTPEAISSDGKTGLAWVPDLQPLAAWDEAERKWRAS